MVAVFFVAILLIVAIAIWVVNKFVDNGVTPPKVYKLRPWAAIAVVIAGLVLAFSSINIVPPGKVAIPVAFGKVGTSVGSGFHIFAPWVSLKEFSTREEQYTMVHSQSEGAKNGDDSVPVLGANAGTAQVDATLLYHVAVSDAGLLYKSIGTDFVDKIIRPTSRTCIRNEFARFPIVEASTTNRDQVSTDIQDCIAQNFTKHSLILDNFQLRNVDLDPKIKASVSSKIAAQQAAEQKVFEIQQAEGSARVTVTNAKATADSQQILACGGTKAQTKDSTGTLVGTIIPNDVAHCNQSQLTPAFLQFQYILALKSLVDSPNSSTVILPFDQKLTPLLNVK